MDSNLDTQPKSPLPGDSLDGMVRGILPLRKMWAVIDPQGNINHTTICCRDEDAIKEWIEQEQAIGVLIAKRRIAQSWEVFEAEGYRVEQVDIIPANAALSNGGEAQ